MSAPIRLVADSQRPVFLVNSRLGLLYATALDLSLNQRRPHFSRSYVCILPSSLTRVLSSALDCSSRLPVSDYGTVLSSLTLGIISWHRDYTRFSFLSVGSRSRLTSGRGFAYAPHQLVAWTGTTVLRPGYASCVIPSKLKKVREYEPVSHRLRLSSSP